MLVDYMIFKDFSSKEPTLHGRTFRQKYSLSTKTSILQLPLVRASFSLIELLVVMSIFSILASLLSPSLKNALAHSRTVNCKQNLKVIGLAVSLYSESNNERLPSNGGPLINGEYTDWSWDDRLSEFDGRIPLGDSHKSQHWLKQTSNDLPAYTCPNDDIERVDSTMIPRSYVPNWLRNNVKEFYLDDTINRGKNRVGRGIMTVPYVDGEIDYSMSFNDLPNPSQSIGWLEFHHDHNAMGSFKNNSGALDGVATLTIPSYDPDIHGSTESNYLLLDMHVKTMWFPDTLQVLRDGSDGSPSRSAEADPWTINATINNSVIGTFWDCW